jgi:ribonuclease-3
MPLDESRKEKLKDLVICIGYQFERIELLDEALTHSSVKEELPEKVSNERLEFYGDAILGFLVTKHLLKQCRESVQGDLSQKRADLVKNEHLDVVAQEMDLLDFMNKGHSIENNAQKPKWMKSGALEALIAAIFIDGGECEAAAFIRKFVIP